MTDPVALTQSLWNYLQPYLPLLLTEAAKAGGKQAPQAVKAIWQALTGRMEQKPAAKEALEDLRAAPDDPDMQAAFRMQVKKLAREDAAFAAELTELLRAAGTRYEATLTGDGAIAQGEGATAVGAGGVYIGGDASGNTIVTGDGNEVQG